MSSTPCSFPDSETRFPGPRGGPGIHHGARTLSTLRASPFPLSVEARFTVAGSEAMKTSTKQGTLVLVPRDGGPVVAIAAAIGESGRA